MSAASLAETDCAETSPLVVWPTRDVTGWPGLTTPDDRGVIIAPDDPNLQRFEIHPDGIAMLKCHWPTDAHFVGYSINDEVQPRINKTALPDLIEAGQEPRMHWVILEADLPNHGRWENANEIDRAVRRIMRIKHELIETLGIYATSGGLRFLWRLDKPIPVTLYKTWYPQFRDAFATVAGLPISLPKDAKGLSIDIGGAGWHQCFRMPYVRRNDGKPNIDDPMLHISGLKHTLKWEAPVAPTAEPVHQRREGPKVEDAPPGGCQGALRRLDKVCDDLRRVAATGSGRRDALVAAPFPLGMLIEGGCLDEEDVRTRLQQLVMDPSWTEDDSYDNDCRIIDGQIAAGRANGPAYCQHHNELFIGLRKIPDDSESGEEDEDGNTPPPDPVELDLKAKRAAAKLYIDKLKSEKALAEQALSNAKGEKAKLAKNPLVSENPAADVAAADAKIIAAKQRVEGLKEQIKVAEHVSLDLEHQEKRRERGGDPSIVLRQNKLTSDPKPTLDNAANVLRHDKLYASLYYDVFANETYINDEVLLDAHLRRIVDDLGTRYGLDLTVDMANNAAMLVGEERERDSLLEYLDLLVWDGTPRLDNLAEAMYGDCRPVAQTLMRKWLTGAVARAYEPGCMLQGVLILKGDQNRGKSYGLKILAGNFFGDHEIPLHHMGDAMMAMAAAWIHELAEMTTLKSYKIDTVKRWITQTQDRGRVAYGKRAGLLKRRCALAGSTNAPKPLVDDTGNRRFWVIEVKKDVPLAWLKQWRDQLWAEAIVLYRAATATASPTDAWGLSRQENAQLTLANKEHETIEDDPLWIAIDEWLDKPASPDVFTMKEVQTALLQDPMITMNNVKTDNIGKIRACLVRAGCTDRGLGREPTRGNAVGRWWTR